jgi:hypothetical protein
LQQVDKRISLIRRLSGCFQDGRDQRRVKHGVREMVGPTYLRPGSRVRELNEHEKYVKTRY